MSEAHPPAFITARGGKGEGSKGGGGGRVKNGLNGGVSETALLGGGGLEGGKGHRQGRGRNGKRGKLRKTWTEVSGARLKVIGLVKRGKGVRPKTKGPTGQRLSNTRREGPPQTSALGA